MPEPTRPETEVLDAGASDDQRRQQRREQHRRRWQRHRRWPRVLVALVGALALLVIAATATGGWLVQRPFPQVDGTVEVPGLGAEVEVLRDARGVPTVVAGTSADLFFAQGYVHAQDRFWEMDVRRHITAGRLSEMFGESQVETDAFVRTLGWRRVAEAEIGLLNAETRDALQAYADGVNAYLAGRSPTQVSVEYAELGLTTRGDQIEPWNPAD